MSTGIIGSGAARAADRHVLNGAIGSSAVSSACCLFVPLDMQIERARVARRRGRVRVIARLAGARRPDGERGTRLGQRRSSASPPGKNEAVCPSFPCRESRHRKDAATCSCRSLEASTMAQRRLRRRPNRAARNVAAAAGPCRRLSSTSRALERSELSSTQRSSTRVTVTLFQSTSLRARQGREESRRRRAAGDRERRRCRARPIPALRLVGHGLGEGGGQLVLARQSSRRLRPSEFAVFVPGAAVALDQRDRRRSGPRCRPYRPAAHRRSRPRLRGWGRPRTRRPRVRRGA